MVRGRIPGDNLFHYELVIGQAAQEVGQWVGRVTAVPKCVSITY